MEGQPLQIEIPEKGLNSCGLMDKGGETLDTQEKKPRRKRVALAKAPRGSDTTKSFSVDDDGIRDWRDTLHDKRDPIAMKTQFFHDSFDETPLNPIKHLAHVKLDRHETVFALYFVVQIVHELKCH